MNQQKYQCCFCNEKIESTMIDITTLLIISNWDKKKDLQNEQQLFCHIECLRSRLAPNVALYIADIID